MLLCESMWWGTTTANVILQVLTTRCLIMNQESSVGQQGVAMFYSILLKYLAGTCGDSLGWRGITSPAQWHHKVMAFLVVSSHPYLNIWQPADCQRSEDKEGSKIGLLLHLISFSDWIFKLRAVPAWAQTNSSHKACQRYLHFCWAWPLI